MKQLVIILLILKCISGVPRLTPIADTPKGMIKGLTANDGGNYHMFLGIPYAVVDENNPFGHATIHPGFNSTFEATDDSVICPQFNTEAEGSLQCLQLNIYVPSTASDTNLLPVIVYQHGGSYIRGSKSRDNLSPKHLMKHDIIVITINYRLGAYGFLCVNEPSLNNQGMKDQLLAFQWVKENVAAFGGDKDKITAAGQSAGAITLDALMLSQKNLAKRAILMSGISLMPWVVVPKNDSIPISIAKHFGYKNDDLIEAIEYLTKKDPIKVIEATKELNIMEVEGHPLTRPCIEGNEKDAVLPDYPVNLKPKVNDMEILIGHTNKEALFIYPKTDEKYYANYRFKKELSTEFNEVYNEDIVKHFYLDDKEASQDLKDIIIDYASDFAFVHPTERSIKKYIDEGAKVFSYMFSYEGGRNRNKIRHNLTDEGACHGDDLGYLYEMNFFENETPNEDDQKMIDVMTTLWTNFVKYGNPTPTRTALLPFHWQPTSLTHRSYLHLGNPVTIDSRPFADRMAFWDLYYELHGHQIKGYKGK